MDGHQIVVAGMSAPIVCAPLNGTSRPQATPVEWQTRQALERMVGEVRVEALLYARAVSSV